jgi:hypothetical protein
MNTVDPIRTRLGSFLKDSIRSPLAWLFVTIHAAWFFLAIANMSPPAPAFGAALDRGAWSSATLFAGRPFHFTYESMLLKLLFFIDLPSLLASVPVGLLLSPVLRAFHFGFYRGSYVGASVLLFLSSEQWLVFGRLIESRLTNHANSPERLNRIFTAAIALILLFTLLTVPIIDARSRRLGFRHAAISFH